MRDVDWIAETAGADLAGRLLAQQRPIFRLAAERAGPWIAVVQRHGLELLDLDR